MLPLHPDGGAKYYNSGADDIIMGIVDMISTRVVRFAYGLSLIERFCLKGVTRNLHAIPACITTTFADTLRLFCSLFYL